MVVKRRLMRSSSPCCEFHSFAFTAKAATGVAAITLGMVLWQTLDGGV